MVNSSKNWLARIIELGVLPGDDANLRQKKITITLVALIIGPLAFFWGLIYVKLGHPLSGAIPLSYFVVSVLSLAYLFKTKKSRFIEYSQLTLVLFLPFILMWTLGGFAGGSVVMIWAVYSPVAAVTFLKKRQALIWFLMYFVLILVSVLIDDYVASIVTPLPHLFITIFYLLNVGFGSAGLYLLVSIAFNEEKRLADTNFRIAAAAFDSHESMLVTDAQGVILRVNKAFTENTGYTAEEIVGQTPRILKSGRHDADFYHAMWESVASTGKWQGEIWDRRKNGEVYPKLLTISAVKNDDNVTTHYVGAHIDITDKKAAAEEINHLAFYDHLTNLPNRLLFKDRLRQTLHSSSRSGRKGALLFIDLDNFKNLNDTLGHVIGDLLLQQVAERLVGCVREGDTIARLGGDEFVVILEELSERTIEAAEQAEAVGEKILATLGRPYQLKTHIFHSFGSIGATIFSGDTLGAEDLLKQADIAMYQAKKAGRNTLRFFDQKMQEVISARAELENELHKALEKRQFQLYYQIQMDSLRRSIGAEALIRWIHPERGQIPPSEFIPLAEETGLILPIGQWALEAACAQLKAWENKPLTRHLTLAVNVSAKRFYQSDFVTQIRNAVQKSGINPKLLKLELTESMLLGDIDDTVNTMNALKEIGIAFSLDDFGTGYSSLQYLKRLPLSQIKIDQSFVRDITHDPNDAAIVQTIIAMTETLGLDVIAEGVETEAQREYLELRGCNNYQGFLFSKPVPVEQFEELLKEGTIYPISVMVK